MLHVNNIFVNYGNFKVLHGISLDIKAGEIVALLGGNGAGKSTTINAISGTNELVSGDIIFNGENLINLPAEERVKRGIVQVPEGRRLFPYMTVLDNLLVGSYIPKARAERKKNLEKCFEIFPKLAERKKQFAGSLSGGEQQMCAIARALMQEPKLLMFDEPSLGLAPVIVDLIFDVIQNINKTGITVLLVEQNVITSLNIASRGYVIEVGENVISGSSAELLNNEAVKKAYMGI